MPDAQWRPFRFKGLPKYSRESAALLAAFSRYLAVSHFGRARLGAVATTASELLRQPVDIMFDHLRPMTFEELAFTIPDNACLVRVGLAPHETKLLWEIDPILAAAAVDRLLGGKGEEFGLNRPFTDLEQGVLTYALLKLAQAMQAPLEQGTELAVRIETFAQSLDVFRSLYPDDLTFHSLAYKVSFGSSVGFSRVFVPHTLTASAFCVPEEDETSEPFWRNARQNLGRIGERFVLGRVEAATLDLTQEDLDALDAGDIVMLENHQLSGAAADLQGVARVRLGRGKNGHLETQLLWRNGRADLQISQIVIEQEPQNMAEDNEEQPADAAEVEEGGEPPASDDNLPESEGLLRDLPAPVVVELGRLKLSTAQVIRLRAGQILRLGRGPSDPVNLVVNNRIFARGELIEVDGELGVRLIQLAK